MKPRTKIVLFVLVLLGLAGAATGYYLFNLKEKDMSKEKPDFVITAADLQKAFEDDEVSAAARYVGKTVEVSGEINAVTPGENNSLNVALKTGSDFAEVICTFRDAAAAGKPEPGKQVTMRGKCSGYLMDVLLQNCVIVRE
jgi:hypothetical protein